MDHFQPAVDPRKQELLETRFIGARVSYKTIEYLKFFIFEVWWQINLADIK